MVFVYNFSKQELIIAAEKAENEYQKCKEDIRERDIKQERLDAYDRMKHGSSRKNFDWYYGSRSKVIYYLLPMLC